MSAFKLLLFLSISNSYFTSYALVTESLISDNVAFARVFTYQAAFMGKRNGSNIAELQGSGGIISDYHILGAAQTFIDEEGEHRKFTFFAVVDQNNLQSECIILRTICRIYFPEHGSYLSNDMAVAELDASLSIDRNPNLSKLNLAEFHSRFITRSGRVAGYGYHTSTTKENEDGKDVFNGGELDQQLRFAKVEVLSSRYCRNFLDRVYPSYFCGKMFSEQVSRNWGLCKLDHGSPLVLKDNDVNVVVGVASSHNPECDDSYFGGLYTGVAYNYNFIKTVLEQPSRSSARVIINRPHLLGNELPESSSSSLNCRNSEIHD